jgi:two-component system, chemotaxis family, sensor kinase CheA
MPFDRSLLEVFAAEQAEHVQRLRSLTETLAVAAPEEAGPPLDEALRRTHTLKGAARAVGLEPTEQISHCLETLFINSRSSGTGLDRQTVAGIHHGLDAIEDLLAAVLTNRPEPDPAAILDELNALCSTLPESQPAPPPPAPGDAAPSLPLTATPSTELVRVRATSIDDLIRSSSQLLAAAGAESLGANAASEHAARAEDALSDFLRLRRECRSYTLLHEDDPDLTRVWECLEHVEGQLRELLGGARAVAVAQKQRREELRQRTAEVHQSAVRVRMTPAESVFGAFGAMVREIAHEGGKDVEFRAEGLDVQADRVVLQALKDPVMHLLRNAVSHGIERPAERLAAGKPEAGAVWLSIHARGDRLYLSVEDDGHGLDLKAVAEQAVKRGLRSGPDLAGQSRDDVARLIFEPGLSTSRVITSLSGRGMGLAIVAQAVSQLQGEIDVRPRKDSGLQIVISVALSISTQQLLLVSVGAHTFGIPSHFAQRLMRIRMSDVETVEGREMILVDARPVQLVRLADLLGLPAVPLEAPSPGEDRRWRLPVAVLAYGDQRVAVQVDRFVDDREMVVKELGLPASLSGITAGGVPLEDGTVATVLNAPALFDRTGDAERASGVRRLAQARRKLRPGFWWWMTPSPLVRWNAAFWRRTATVSGSP